MLMSRHEKYLAPFADVTGAALVAGREGLLPYEAFLGVIDRAVEHSLSGGRALRCVPAYDFSEDPLPEDLVPFMVGYTCGAAATAGYAPGRVTREEIEAALAAARGLEDAFWGSLHESLASEPTLVKAVPFGPLAGVAVAFGVRENAGMTVDDLPASGAEEEDDDVDSTDWEAKLAAPPAGLRRVIGKDMEQRSHPDHILGLDLGYDGDWAMVPFEFSEALHAARVAKLAAHGLATPAAYWVVGVYD